MLRPLLSVEMSFRVAGARVCAPCQKWSNREGFVAFPKTMAGVGHLKRIWKDACRMAGAVQDTCSSKCVKNQGADFLRGFAFWSIRSSGLLRWFCVTGAAYLRFKRFALIPSYARGCWRFKVASSVAVAVGHGNAGGSFSGNKELVARLMAECDGKNVGSRILVAKGGNIAWQKLSRKFSNRILAAAVKIWRQLFGQKRLQTPSVTKEALSVHGTCWQKGERVWETFPLQMGW